jgi:hypothetical protein
VVTGEFAMAQTESDLPLLPTIQIIAFAQTMSLMGEKLPEYWSLRDQVCIDAASNGLELGYRFIDTAAFYGNNIGLVA